MVVEESTPIVELKSVVVGAGARESIEITDANAKDSSCVGEVDEVVR